MIDYSLSKYVTEIFKTQGNEDEWGGYYNYDFLSEDHSKLLCNFKNPGKAVIEFGDYIDVGYYDILKDTYCKIDSTDCFNWPQASMLQWLPNSKSKKIIFNLSTENHIISRIVDIESGEKRDLCYPIYGITPDGKYSITLNFERILWTYAYHYQAIKRDEYNVDVLEGDGVFRLNITDNSLEKIIDIYDIIKLDYVEDFEGVAHWIEHIMISPSGKRFCFLHRFSTRDGGRNTRIIISDIDGKNFRVVGDWKKNTWSHFGWKSDDEFVVDTRFSYRKPNIRRNGFINGFKNLSYDKSVKNATKTLIQCIYCKVFSKIISEEKKTQLSGMNMYQQYVWDGETWNLSGYHIGKMINIDGHPSFGPDNRYMVTDTYCDENKIRRLIVWDTIKDRGLILGKFYDPLWRTASSCDLHPKMSKDGNLIVVDTAYDGRHRMMVLKVNWDLIKQKLG